MPESFFFSFSEIVPSIVCIFHFMTLWRLWCIVLLQSSPCKAFLRDDYRPPGVVFPSDKEILSVNNLIHETAKSLLFTYLYQLLNPLFAFSIYFGIWHGLGCIHDFIIWLKQNDWAGLKQNLLESKEENVSINDYIFFYKLAAPYTLVSIFGMGILYILWGLFRHDQNLIDLNLSLVWAVFIGCISVLTGGHIWCISVLNGGHIFTSGIFKTR